MLRSDVGLIFSLYTPRLIMSKELIFFATITRCHFVIATFNVVEFEYKSDELSKINAEAYRKVSR